MSYKEIEAENVPYWDGMEGECIEGKVQGSSPGKFPDTKNIVFSFNSEQKVSIKSMGKTETVTKNKGETMILPYHANLAPKLAKIRPGENVRITVTGMFETGYNNQTNEPKFGKIYKVEVDR